MAPFSTEIQLPQTDTGNCDLVQRQLEVKPARPAASTKTSAYIAGHEVVSLDNNITLQDVNQAVFKASETTGKALSFFVFKHDRRKKASQRFTKAQRFF